MHATEPRYRGGVPPYDLAAPGWTGEGGTGAGYWCEAIAYLPEDGRSFWLAACPVSSPRLAMQWLTDRVERIAEQLDPAAAHQARGWFGDQDAHQRMLLALTTGNLFTHTIADDGDGVRHLLLTRPVPAVVPTWDAVPTPAGRTGW